MRRTPLSVGELALGAAVLCLAGCASTTRSAIEPATSRPLLRAIPEGGEASLTERRVETLSGNVLAPQETPQYSDPFASERLFMYRLDVGMRRYDGTWAPSDEPLVLSAGVTYEPEYWPLGIEAAFTFATSDDDVDGSGYRSTNYELTLGGSKSFWPIEDALIWTFGGGLSVNYLRDRIDLFTTPPPVTQRFSGSEWWAAFYLHTRLAWKFSDTFDVGLDLRGGAGQSVSTVGPVRSSNNGQLMLSLGIHR